MPANFEGFHPNDFQSKVRISLTDSGIEYTNLRTGAFQFMSYAHIAGFSGWIPNYGSLHIFSSNENLTIHVNFDQTVAAESLNQIKAILTAQLKQQRSMSELEPAIS